MSTESVSKATEPHLKKFERFEREAKQPAWLFPLRKAGLARFAERGFPTINDEDWRFTNVNPLTKLPFEPVFEPARAGLTPADTNRFAFAELPATRLVFVDGHYVAELSSPETELGVSAVSLKAALASQQVGIIEKHLGRYASDGDNSFSALNTAFFQDGAFIHVPAGKTVQKPIHLLFVSTATQIGATSHPRNLILAEKGSLFTV